MNTKDIHEAKYVGTCLGDVESEGFKPTLAGNALLLERYSKELTEMAREYLADGLPPANLKEINLTFNRLQSCLKSLRGQLEAISGPPVSLCPICRGDQYDCKCDELSYLPEKGEDNGK